MNKKETNTLKRIRNGLWFVLMAGMVACYGETEVAEDDAVADDVAVADTRDADEYYTTFGNTTYYGDWDVDNDRFLNEEEFTASFFQTWDLNNDGRISQGEWNTVISDYSNGIDATNWQAWDTDGDGFMERVEFDASFPAMGWRDSWDTDSDDRITNKEYAAGIFTLWDTNGDNVLDETEYKHHQTYYGR